MKEKIIYAPDIANSIASVIDHLKANDQGRQALIRANFLLTNLMTMLRPIRIKEQQPGGPKVTYAGEQLGLSLARIRLLKDSVFRGVKEIEAGRPNSATETFTLARDSWQSGEQKPPSDAQGD